MENKSLFQISAEYLALAEFLEYDELTPEIEKSLKINQEELQVKAKNYLHVIANLKAQIQMAKDAEAQAKTYRAYKEKAVERLEGSLLDAVKLFGKFEAGVYTVSSRKSEKVVVQFPDVVPEEYCRKKLVVEPDKAKIKAALQNGTNVIGCHLEQNTSLAIR